MPGQRCRRPTRLVYLLQFTACLLMTVSFYIQPADGQKPLQRNWNCRWHELSSHNYRTPYAFDLQLISNMGELEVGKECTYVINGIPATEITIERSFDYITPCTAASNSLILRKKIDGEEHNLTLLCGREMTEWLVVDTPFTLVYRKLATSGSLEFNILLKNFKTSEASGSYISHTFEVSRQPRFVYSPLYPEPYLSNQNFQVKFKILPNNVIVFQPHSMDLINDPECVDTLTISGGNYHEEYCGKDLRTVILKQLSPYQHDLSMQLKSLSGNSGGGYKIEYRTVEAEPTIRCDGSKIKRTVAIWEPTFISIRLAFNSSVKVDCEVTLTSGDPRKALLLRDGTAENTWSDACLVMKLDIFSGGSKLPSNRCDHPYFSFIRGESGKDIRIVSKANVLDLYKPYKGLEVGFVVEALSEPDDGQPEATMLHTQPSFTWIPTGKQYTFEIKSAESSCAYYKRMSKSGTTLPGPWDVDMAIYNGRDVENDFDVTKDCLGDSIESKEISNFGKVTTVVTKGNDGSGYWLVISKAGDPALCKEMTPIPLTIKSAGKDYNLFSRLKIKRNMNCVFKLLPMPLYHETTKFKGSLKKLNGAELIIKEEKRGSKTTLVDFGIKTSKYWFYTKYNLTIYFNVGAEMEDGMATFTYGSKYGQGERKTRSEACFGPDEWTLFGKQEFKTPDYPNHLTSDLKCSWIIKRPVYAPMSNKYIHITYDMSGLSCNSSTKFYIGEVNTLWLDPLCDQAGPRSLVFRGDVKITLSGGPDHVIDGVSFIAEMKELSYHENCNTTHDIDVRSQNLKISGYLIPGSFVVPFRCWWKVYSQEDHVVFKTQMDYVNIPGNNFYSGCSYNNIIVYDGSSTNSRQLVRTCTMEGKSYYSSGNYVLIYVSIDKVPPKPVQFNVTVRAGSYQYQCRRTINHRATHDDQYLVSPGYPANYVGNLNCEYLIESYDDNIEVEILDLHIEYQGRCLYDYLAIYDGSSVSSQLLVRKCGIVRNEPKYRSSGRSLFIKFKTDENGEERGFKIRYYTKKSASPDIVNKNSNSDEDESGNKTGMIIGACLAAIVCIFIITFIVVWFVNKKRLRDNRRRRRRLRDSVLPNLQFNSSSQESSVFMINPVIYSNGGMLPPPYPGITNEGFVDEPPPSYQDSLNLGLTVSPAEPLTEPPPPSYSASISAAGTVMEQQQQQQDQPHGTIGRDGPDGGPVYNSRASDYISNENIYETLRQPRRGSESQRHSGDSESGQPEQDTAVSVTDTTLSDYSLAQENSTSTTYDSLDEDTNSLPPEYSLPQERHSPIHEEPEYSFAQPPEDNIQEDSYDVPPIDYLPRSEEHESHHPPDHASSRSTGSENSSSQDRETRISNARDRVAQRTRSPPKYSSHSSQDSNESSSRPRNGRDRVSAGAQNSESDSPRRRYSRDRRQGPRRRSSSDRDSGSRSRNRLGYV